MCNWFEPFLFSVLQPLDLLLLKHAWTIDIYCHVSSWCSQSVESTTVWIGLCQGLAMCYWLPPDFGRARASTEACDPVLFTQVGVVDQREGLSDLTNGKTALRFFPMLLESQSVNEMMIFFGSHCVTWNPGANLGLLPEFPNSKFLFSFSNLTLCFWLSFVKQGLRPTVSTPQALPLTWHYCHLY